MTNDEKVYAHMTSATSIPSVLAAVSSDVWTEKIINTDIGGNRDAWDKVISGVCDFVCVSVWVSALYNENGLSYRNQNF